MKILNKKNSRNLHTANHEPPGNFNLPEVSARRYQDLFNNASDAIFIRDLKGNIIEVNEAAVILTGYLHNELTGMNVSEFLTAESFKTTMKKQKALLEDEAATQRYELEIVRKDGVRLSAESRTSLLTYNGRPPGVQCIVKDITERKRVEEALRENEERFRSLTENTSDWIWEVNVDGVYTYASPKVKDLLGYEPEEVVGNTPFDLMPPEEAKRIAEEFRAIVESQRPFTVLENTNLHKDGRLVVLETSGVPFFNADGRLCGYRGIDRDITERKRAEEALRKSEERYKELAESITDVFFAFNEELRYTYWNKASEELTGISAKDALGKDLYDLFPDTEMTRRAEEVYLRALRTKQPQHFINEYQLGGKDFFFEISAYPSKDGLSVFVKDITKRKQAEEEELRKFKTISDRAGYGAAVSRLDGNLVYVNESFAKMHGYTIEDLIGKHFSILHTKEQMRLVERLRNQFLQTGSYSAEEVWHKRKDGTVFPTSMTGTAIIDDKGKPLYLSATAIDITERKQAEEALQESEERYRTVADFTYDWEYWIGPDGDFRYISPSCERMTGYRVDEFLRDPKLLDRIIHPDDYPVIAQHINGAFKSKEALHADFRIISRSGEERWIAHWCQPVYGNDGSWLGRRGSNRDITQRKRVEEEGRIAEQNFRNSLDSSPLGIRIVTAEGELLYANQAILDIYGYSNMEELKATPTKKRYTPKSYAEHQERVKKRKLGKPVLPNYEISIVRKDGEVRHLEVFRKEVIWSGGTQFQTLYQDITEQKLTAEELKIFKAISDRAGYGAGIITPEGELIYISESFARMHGYTIEELIGKHFSIFHTEEQMQLVERLRKKLIQAGSYVGKEVWHKKKDGTVFPTLMTGTAIKDDKGKPLYLSATAIDITESKRVEMALQQSEEFNSSLLTNSPSPILVLNADASIRYVNPALERLTGFSSAELVGSKPPYPWWMEETHKELSRRLMQAMRRGTRKYESLYKKKNGERFWVEKIFKTVRINGEFRYYLVNWVDLTEQKRLKANMEFYLSEVTRAQEEERKRIAREIHDESIQSLSTLALGIDAIAKEKEKLPEDVIRRLKGLRAETNSILDELRRFSHELRPGVIDQIGLVPALEILTEELNKENRVKASLEVAGSERRPIPEIELALFRIAQEALHNVKKHSRATKAVIKLKFTRSRVKLTVSDNGRGFELPDMLSDLAAEGKLGLIGMQERTRLLGGKLLVRSWVSRGTTVVVEVANIQGMKG